MADAKGGVRKMHSSRHRLEARHLRLVLAIARHGSVTRAAKDLNLSQSALSHQLLNLERDLGLALFHRIGKTMVATPAGTRLHDYAQRILAELSAAEEAILAEDERGRVPLRLTTGCYTHYPWLAMAVSRFCAAHPRIDARIIFDETKNELAALKADQVDMIVTTRPPTNNAFARYELFSDDTVAVLAIDHPLVNRKGSAPIRWGDLADDTVLIYDIPEEDEVRLQQAIQKSRPSVSLQIWRVQLTEAIIELAAAKQGIGVVGTRYMQPYLEDPRLRFIPLGPGSRRSYWAVWHNSNRRRLPFSELAKEVRAAWKTVYAKDQHILRKRAG